MTRTAATPHNRQTDSSLQQTRLGSQRQAPLLPGFAITKPSDVVALQSTAGSRAVSRLLKSGSGTPELIQTKLASGSAGDRYEREADDFAKRVAKEPASPTSSSSQNEQHLPTSSPTFKASMVNNTTLSPLPSAALEQQIDQRRGAGQPLPGTAKQEMASHLSDDLSAVRIHTDSNAARMNRALNSNAFTVGQDIYFAQGRYQQGTQEGRGLLAHELAHTQQQTGANSQFGQTGQQVVQRQESQSKGTEQITAKDIFPFPVKSRVVLGRILSDATLNQIGALVPQVSASLRGIDKQVATVTMAAEDRFEAVINAEIKLPASKQAPAVTLQKVTMRLTRTGNTFDFELVGEVKGQTLPVSLFERRDLEAKRVNGNIILSKGSEKQLRVSPGEDEDQLRLSAYTAPFISESDLPEFVKNFLKNNLKKELKLIHLQKLPNVGTGTVKEKEAIEGISGRISSQRRWRRHRLRLGAGVMLGEQLDPLLTTSWQMNFIPYSPAGTLLQLPLEVQLQYAPSTSIIGSVTGGVDVSLSQLSIPVNVRLVAGGAAGTISGAQQEGSQKRPTHPVAGTVLGGSSGYESKVFRLDLRYEWIKNFVGNGPDIQEFQLRAGWAF